MKIDDSKNYSRFFYKAQTKNGFRFDPNEDIWKINDTSRNSIYNFNEMNISKTLKFNLKNIVKYYLENNSVSHTSNMWKYLKLLFKNITDDPNNCIKTISDIDLINFRSYLGKTNEHYLGSLSGFLKKWYEMGDSCVTTEAYEYLKETKFKGNKKGEAVLTMCPIKGAFTDLELERIQDSINNSYAKEQINKGDYILVWLFMIYGSRPIQFAQLKVKDIIFVKQDDNNYEVFIMIPRVKNRKDVRNQFKRRIVPKALSSALVEYCNDIKNFMKERLSDTVEAPLFIKSNYKDNHISTEKMKYHITSQDITLKIQSIFNKLDLKSERTGEKLNVIPIRFRRTIGTRAASEGHGSLIIAEILDHSDTQNAQVYVEATPEIIERIDKAIALHMAPIAQAFAGTLVKDKSKALRAEDPTADIINPTVDKTCKPTGKCGSHSYCGQMSPLACYTCSSFQAWTDGPHEEVLEHLIIERERLLEISDHRIASVNDKTIMAVAQVVKACREYKQENINEVIVDVLN